MTKFKNLSLERIFQGELTGKDKDFEPSREEKEQLAKIYEHLSQLYLRISKSIRTELQNEKGDLK